MNDNFGKIMFWSVLGITVVGGGIGAYLLIRDETRSEDLSNDTPITLGGKKSKPSSSNKNDSTDTNTPPVIDDETALIGKNVFPKSGTVNVRETPKVDNGKELFGVRVFDNIIGEVSPPNKIGTIREVVYGDEKIPYRWYKVTLDNKIEGISSGYVREDVVNIN